MSCSVMAAFNSASEKLTFAQGRQDPTLSDLHTHFGGASPRL
jgi:hypothetical protein